MRHCPACGNHARGEGVFKDKDGKMAITVINWFEELHTDESFVISEINPNKRVVKFAQAFTFQIYKTAKDDYVIANAEMGIYNRAKTQDEACELARAHLCMEWEACVDSVNCVRLSDEGYKNRSIFLSRVVP